MKALFLAAMLAQAPAPAPAAVQLPRADAHVVLGWQNIHKEQPQDHYNDWLNNIFYGGGGAGWYWTENLKTQVDVGTGTRATQYRTRQVPFGNNFAYESSQLNVSQWAVTVGQQYQFFHNAWFHPRVGAGIELARETTREVFQPVILYGTNPPIPREILPARTEGPDHQFIARGMGEVGFKAYMTRRSFFTGDMRVMFRNGVDQVLFRAGFGIDF
jgi:Outer membrane protein beta-barrel domain